MALLHTHFFSESLGMQCTMDVILPQKPATPLVPSLWLLHGLSDDHSIWQRRTSIERYVESLNVAVIMPNVHRSFYADMAHGYRYGAFIADELPHLARTLFKISSRREDTFVAGLSMGGYGAFKLALNHPERYAAAASLSGALDMAARYRRSVGTGALRTGDMDLVYGDDPTGTPNDLLHAASTLAVRPDPRPRLYQWCGTEDYLLADNVCFRDHAAKLGLSVDYSESAGGHTWDCWDARIQDVLKWMAFERV